VGEWDKKKGGTNLIKSKSYQKGGGLKEGAWRGVSRQKENGKPGSLSRRRWREALKDGTRRENLGAWKERKEIWGLIRRQGSGRETEHRQRGPLGSNPNYLDRKESTPV